LPYNKCLNYKIFKLYIYIFFIIYYECIIIDSRLLLLLLFYYNTLLIFYKMTNSFIYAYNIIITIQLKKKIENNYINIYIFFFHSFYIL